MKERQAYQQVRTVANNVERTQDVGSGASMVSAYDLHTPTPKIQQPKADATDRRQTEAQNEDKAHATKETLDNIKRIHQKEKKKKEENDIEHYPTRIESEGQVNKILIFQQKLPS